MALDGFNVVCLEPGADNPKKHEPPPDPEPPEGFVDNTVYRYRIDEDGNKVLIGTMDAFPEGWHRSKTDWEKGFQKKKEDKAKMARYYWKALWPQAQELLAQGLSTAKVAEKLGIDAPALRCKIDRERRKAERQTPEPEPAEAANQEPIQGSQEPANQSVAQEKPEITVKDVLQYELAQREQGFGPEDDEPIPYTVAASRTWTDEAKEQARKLKAEGLTMRQIAEEIGFTYRQVKGFFERERKKQRKPNQNDVLSKYKVKWIRDVMLDDLDPGVQLRIVSAVQGLEI